MSKWIGKPSPKSMRYGSGWVREMDRVFIDGEYCVMIRNVETPWGTVEHACMRNVKETDIPWVEKQRIKNELFGEDRTAVEVFPATEKLVDAANMYHFWVLPKEMELPFGLK